MGFRLSALGFRVQGLGFNELRFSRPKSNLGTKRVPVFGVEGLIREPKLPKKGNKGLLWVLGFGFRVQGFGLSYSARMAQPSQKPQKRTRKKSQGPT